MKIFILGLLSLVMVLEAKAGLKVQQISNNVYALIGELTQRSKTNFANNSTHGVIVTKDGVILIDSGGSYLGAKQIEETIKTITNKPIKIVINTGGQDHRWFGNEYFAKQGIEIIASKSAQKDQNNRANQQMARLERLIGNSLKGTNPYAATTTFESKKEIKLGNTVLELYYFGPAHTQGDITVWMPQQNIMFTGDIVFNNRMLGIGPARNFQSWINVFEEIAKFKPNTIIPGHGDPSNFSTAKKNTYDYLMFLKTKIGELIDNDGSLSDINKIDQSDFSYLQNYESISKKNASWVFEQMEFE